MKKKELEKLKKLTAKELEKLASDKRDEIMTAKVSFISGKETNSRKVRSLRHELAQILTISTIISRAEKDKPVLESKKTKK